MALTIVPATFDPDHYQDANLTTVLAWKAKSALLEKAVSKGLPWHLHVYPHREGLTEKLKASLTKLHADHPGLTGWLVWDEAQHVWMSKAAETIQWLKQNYPDTLVYSNGLPTAGVRKLYGDDPPDGQYTYEQYQNDFVDIMDVDVLCYDAYRFHEDGTTGT